MPKDSYKAKLIEKKKSLTARLEKYKYPLDWREISNIKHKIASVDGQLKDKSHIKQAVGLVYSIPKLQLKSPI